VYARRNSRNRIAETPTDYASVVGLLSRAEYDLERVRGWRGQGPRREPLYHYAVEFLREGSIDHFPTDGIQCKKSQFRWMRRSTAKVPGRISAHRHTGSVQIENANGNSNVVRNYLRVREMVRSMRYPLLQKCCAFEHITNVARKATRQTFIGRPT
jgi:hypothetical protein